MQNLLVKIREALVKNSAAIVGGAALLFAIVDYLNGLGLIEEWPKTIVSIFGGLNILLSWFGLEPIQVPDNYKEEK